MKRCAKCNQTKNKTEFYKGDNKDGLRSYCKECCKISKSSTKTKRSIQSSFWLSADERAKLDQILSFTGLSQREYITACILRDIKELNLKGEIIPNNK